MPARSTRERDEREARRRTRLFNARQRVHAQRVARRRRDDRIAVGVFVLVAVLATLAQIAYFGAGPGRHPAAAPTVKPTASASPTASATAPPASAAENRTWTGSLTLNSTKLAIRLDGKKAPRATANFVSLVRKGFYRNVSCHRLTTGSLRVLQCGDPKGNGSGGPGYTFGPVENAPKDDSYPTGTIAMARQGGNGSSQGSQFFLVYGTSTIPSDAAGGYTVFGSITKGLPALKSSVTSKGVAGGGSDGAPKVPTRITAVSVR